LSVLLAVMAWLFGRPRGPVLPSDTFFLCYLVLMGLAPILNPSAFSPVASELVFSDAAIQKGLLGISISFWIFSFVWLLRPRLSSEKVYRHASMTAVRPVVVASGPILWAIVA